MHFTQPWPPVLQGKVSPKYTQCYGISTQYQSLDPLGNARLSQKEQGPGLAISEAIKAATIACTVSHHGLVTSVVLVGGAVLRPLCIRTRTHALAFRFHGFSKFHLFEKLQPSTKSKLYLSCSPEKQSQSVDPTLDIGGRQIQSRNEEFPFSGKLGG